MAFDMGRGKWYDSYGIYIKEVLVMAILQAHRGVSTECPENTMPAFTLAIEQGYGYIETDPLVTKDGKVVLHHDATINRTGRNADGSPIEGDKFVAEMTYQELLEYDFGIFKHPKFAGTKLPLMEELLPLAREKGVKLKLDAKILKMSQEHQEILYALIADWQDICELSTKTEEQTVALHERFPDMQLHYGGPCLKPILERLKEAVGKDKLNLWLPYPNLRTAYAYSGIQGIRPDILQVPELTAERARMVKKYGRLGVWNLADESEFTQCRIMGVHIVETNGEVKPERNWGVLSDNHVHTEHSHDAKVPMAEMYGDARKKGVKIIAVADHYDGCFCADGPYSWDHIKASNAEADAITAQYGGDGMVLRSIELGEPQWDPEQTKRVIAESNFDVVVGSIHAVKSPMFEDKQLLKRCFSQLKYNELTAEQTHELLTAYYNDNLEMVKTQDIDILAHLTCVVGYFMTRHGIFMGVEQFRDKIREILQVIIRRGIALEVNPSGFPGTGLMSPHMWILQMYRDMGGYLITMASDAHTPARLGVGYDEGVQMLKQMGFKHVYYFKDRKPVQCTLL